MPVLGNGRLVPLGERRWLLVVRIRSLSLVQNASKYLNFAGRYERIILKYVDGTILKIKPPIKEERHAVLINYIIIYNGHIKMRSQQMRYSLKLLLLLCCCFTSTVNI